VCTIQLFRPIHRIASREAVSVHSKGMTGQSAPSAMAKEDTPQLIQRMEL